MSFSGERPVTHQYPRDPLGLGAITAMRFYPAEQDEDRIPDTDAEARELVEQLLRRAELAIGNAEAAAHQSQISLRAELARVSTLAHSRPPLASVAGARVETRELIARAEQVIVKARGAGGAR